MPYKHTRSMNDDDDDELSQYSRAPDSDDRDIEMYAKAVAEFKMTWQKQKKEKQRKFLKAAQTDMDEHVDRKIGQVRQIMKEMEETYQTFLSNYAANEGQQREVLVKIAEAQKTLVALSVKKHQETIELTQNLEEGHLEGVKQLKETYQGMSEMIDAFMKI